MHRFVWLAALAALSASCLLFAPPTAGTGSPTTQPTAGAGAGTSAGTASVATTDGDACSGLCAKYLACYTVEDEGLLGACVGWCRTLPQDPEAAARLQALGCTEYTAVVEGRAQAPAGPSAVAPQPQGAGGPAALAGVWVGEESSLDPGLYLRMTQYLTLYPDGGVSWSKDEGGASRTRVSETFVQFRSWREGSPPPTRIHGHWQSDGASITVQWDVWNNRRSSGRVQGNGFSLSGMGILEEGSTLTFTRQE
ncbi:MAG: hypothetical protein HY908_16310 [Myxococcales bacterium]|nr:hypothetical protein [Myxococcales bacterium]